MASCSVPALRPNAGWLVLLVACLWNLRWDWKMGLLTTAVYAGGYALVFLGIVAFGLALALVARLLR